MKLAIISLDMRIYLIICVITIISGVFYSCRNTKFENSKYVLASYDSSILAEIIEFETGNKFYYTGISRRPEGPYIVSEGTYVIIGDSVLLDSPKPRLEEYRKTLNTEYLKNFVSPTFEYESRVISFDSIYLAIRADSLVYDFRNEQRILIKI